MLTGFARDNIIVWIFMVKRLIKILFVIYIITFLFTGCSGDARPVEATGPQKPTSEIEGFYEQQQTVSGGTGGSAMNLADIKIEAESTDITKVTLTFGQGSQSEDKSFIPSKSVPKYTTSFIKGINRMVLTMEGVSYFSYKIYEQEIQSSFVNGIFAQRPVDTALSKLYLNIGSDYAYKAEAYKNQIVITLHKVAQSQQDKSFYVTLNAYDQFADGYLDESFPMMPTMCTDGENILMISKPFSSKEQSQEYIEQNKGYLTGVLAGKKFSIQELLPGQLPEFSVEGGLEEVAGTAIGYKDGAELTFDPLIVNGRFLCYNHDGTAFVYAQPNTIYGDQEGDSFSFEYLYIERNGSGLTERLLENQFSSITGAQFSHDSKYLAFIEQNDVLRKLHILSLSDGKLYVPADDSFGSVTASFVWNETRDILYAINGEFQSKQLLSYDLTDPDNVKVKGVFEQEFSESILQIKGNTLFYADRSAEGTDSEICAVDIGSGTCQKVADGNNFMLSPDGRHMLINDVDTSEGREVYRIRYINLDTYEETVIFSGELINNITWSYAGERIYYSVYTAAQGNDEFPYALYYYDIESGETVYVMDTIVSALYPSVNDDEVLLMCIFTYKNQPVPVTYTVK